MVREDGASSEVEGAPRIDHRDGRGRGLGREKEAAVRISVHALKCSFRAIVEGPRISWSGLPSMVPSVFRTVLQGG